MSRITIALLASSLVFVNACVSTGPGTLHKTEVEEVINKRNLPPSVLMVLPKGYEERELTYKRKSKDGIISYDVYYEKGGNQFSINYDEQGAILQEEKRIKFSDIRHDTRIKIEKVLAAYYPGYKILMVEELYTNNETFLEIFFSHPKSKTGLVEAIFNFKTGDLKEFINIKMKSISTMN